MKELNKYAIGMVVQSTDTISKWRSKVTTIKSTIEVRDVTEYDYISNGYLQPPTAIPKIVKHYYLKDKPEAEITFFIGIAKNVTSSIRNAIGGFADGENTYFLPTIRFIYFGETLTLEQMKQRLFIIMDDAWEGYVIIDSNSDITNLLTKFIT